MKLAATLKKSSESRFTLEVAELGLSHTAKAPACNLCRMIMKAAPEYADAPLEVYGENGKLLYTLSRISYFAEKNFYENDSGIGIKDWKPFPETMKAA